MHMRMQKMNSPPRHKTLFRLAEMPEVKKVKKKVKKAKKLWRA